MSFSILKISLWNKWQPYVKWLIKLYKRRKKKSESRKSKRLKIDLGRFPILQRYDETITIAIYKPPLVLPNTKKTPFNTLIFDVLFDNPTFLEAFKEHSETIIDSHDESYSSDDDSYEKSLYDIIREKLLNVNLLIAKIDALRDNPTPSSEVVIKSTSTFPNLFLEETNTLDNSIPESETFSFNLEEISSGNPTTHSDLSLPDYKAFYFPPTDRSDLNHEEFADELAHIISPPEYDHFCFKIEPSGQSLYYGCGE
ncbi:hypothetical protein Tco_0565858 [Tanacetum coccineum]